MDRQLWKCPACQRDYEVPQNCAPAICPSCVVARNNNGQWSLPLSLTNGIRHWPLISLFIVVLAGLFWSTVAYQLGIERSRSVPQRPVPSSLSTPEIYRAVSDSVAVVEAVGPHEELLSAGSGFVVKEGVLTNLHVVSAERAVKLYLRFDDHDITVTDGLLVDQQHDLALITHKFSKPLHLRYDIPSIGSKVIAIGNTFGFRQSVSEGIIAGVRTHGDATLLQTTAQINVGNSGGPLLDTDGHVIGIVTSGVPEANGIGFATSSADISRFLARERQSMTVSDASLLAIAETVVPIPAEQDDQSLVHPLTDLHALTLSFPWPEKGVTASEARILVTQGMKRCGVVVDGKQPPRNTDMEVRISYAPMQKMGAATGFFTVQLGLTEIVTLGSGERAWAQTWWSTLQTGFCTDETAHSEILNKLAECMIEFADAHKQRNK